MDDETEKAEFIKHQRDWLLSYREQTGWSWSKLASEIGCKSSTLSVFGSRNGYAQGDAHSLAEKIERYRQSLTQRAAIASDVPIAPAFYATDTTEQLERMMAFAQLGKIVAAALEAGCSKSSAARHYQSCYTNVFYVEIRHSAGAPNSMLKLVLRALGVKNPTGGTLAMSEQVTELLGKLSSPLLIIDEAQHLNEASLEEIRSWNDDIGVGIALFGNVGVLQKMGRYAQLYSRLSLKLLRTSPLSSDIEKMAEAWNISDAAIRAELQKICGKLGGLRNGTNALQLALMIASSEGKPLALDHLQDAWQELDVRMVAA